MPTENLAGRLHAGFFACPVPLPWRPVLAGNCRAIAAAIVLDLGEAPPNRGVANQPDISLYGLHYHQRVSDADPPPFSTAGPSAAHRAGPVHERAGQPG